MDVTHPATLLPDGRVLVVGGVEVSDEDFFALAEVWDPATSTFSPADFDVGDDYYDATALADGRVLIINKGKIVAMDTPENLTRRLRGGSALNLEVKGDGREVEKAVKKVRGVASVVRSDLDGSSRFRVETGSAEDLAADRREAISRAVTGAGGIILEMKHELLSLEDIFIEITTSEEGA